MKRVPVSVYVLTYNNRRTIEQCLKSLNWAEELVIVDSLQTGHTKSACSTRRAYTRESGRAIAISISMLRI
jgi:glycosyltransferase involved in cell wall biosynthesis